MTITTKEQVAKLLRAVADRVESGDSMEGNIEWLIPSEGKPEELELWGAYRIGNLNGQGGMVIL